MVACLFPTLVLAGCASDVVLPGAFEAVRGAEAELDLGALGEVSERAESGGNIALGHAQIVLSLEGEDIAEKVEERAADLGYLRYGQGRSWSRGEEGDVVTIRIRPEKTDDPVMCGDEVGQCDDDSRVQVVILG